MGNTYTVGNGDKLSGGEGRRKGERALGRGKSKPTLITGEEHSSKAAQQRGSLRQEQEDLCGWSGREEEQEVSSRLGEVG